MPRSLAPVALFLAAAVVSKADLTFTPIAFPGAYATYARAINNRGEVVGDYIDRSGYRHAFTRDNGAYLGFDAPGAGLCDTFGWGVNDSGLVLVTSSTGSCSLPVTYVDATGSFTPVEAPGAAGGTIGHGLNNKGQIVGAYRQTYPNTGDTAFLDSAGNFANIAVPGADPHSTYVWGINDSGAMVGQYWDSAGAHGFSETAGIVTVLNTGFQTIARAVNDSGDIAGFAGGHGFVYQNGAVNLFDPPGSLYGTEPMGINDEGQIVGFFADDSGIHSFLATPSSSDGNCGSNGDPPSSTPEPGILPLVAGFLTIFALAGRKRR